MQVLIEISDEEYKKISNSNPSYADDFPIYYAVKNGTPLPEEHGDLIDRKEWFTEVRDEMEKLAKFHSVEVPIVYGDGEETVDKMVSLEELGRILAEIEDAVSPQNVDSKAV